MTIETLEEKMEDEDNDENAVVRRKLITPRKLKILYPRTEAVKETINKSREEIKDILDKKDNRKIIIIGPCSIHDADEAYTLAKKIKDFADEVKDELVVVYRTYFQKPRTRVGWRGLVYDPRIDGSFRINEGLKISRELLLKINELGIPCATEFLDRAVYKRLGDLISWGAIGARSVEAQDHRDWASGYIMPIGFKNSTLGNIQDSINNAIDACVASSEGKGIFDEDDNGRAIYAVTKGNKYTHVVLRGVKNNGKFITNYDSESADYTLKKLQEAGLKKNIIVDCSHGNSEKDYRKQINVLKSVKEQILSGNEDIVGVMMEVYLESGAYDSKLPGDERRKSRTDACLGIKEASDAINEFYWDLKKRENKLN